MVLRAGWKAPYIRTLSTRRAVVLLYHAISRENDAHSISIAVFRQHLGFLKENFEIIHPDRLFERRKAHEKIRVLLTFDDGFRNHADVLAPELIKNQTPAVFFVSSRHSERGKYLWFNYLRAFKRYFAANVFTFRGESFNLSPNHRAATLHRLTQTLWNLQPHPSAMYEAIENEFPALEDFVPTEPLADFYAGMTAEQIAKLASIPFFHIGAHTVNHPFLSKCDPDGSYREIRDNKRWLEEVTGRPCNSIAYPSGDYDARILAQCGELRFLQGYAVVPTAVSFTNRRLELPRVGLYAGDSLDDLGLKVQWGNLIRTLKIHRN